MRFLRYSPSGRTDCSSSQPAKTKTNPPKIRAQRREMTRRQTGGRTYVVRRLSISYPQITSTLSVHSTNLHSSKTNLYLFTCLNFSVITYKFRQILLVNVIYFWSILLNLMCLYTHQIPPKIISNTIAVSNP